MTRGPVQRMAGLGRPLSVICRSLHRKKITSLGTCRSLHMKKTLHWEHVGHFTLKNTSLVTYRSLHRKRTLHWEACRSLHREKSLHLKHVDHFTGKNHFTGNM